MAASSALEFSFNTRDPDLRDLFPQMHRELRCRGRIKVYSRKWNWSSNIHLGEII